jgi:hypothetical protein
MKHRPRVLPREPVDNNGYEACGQAFAATNPQFSGPRVGEKFERFDALPELIEHGDAALEQCPAIDRGLNSMCSAVEQAQTHGVLDLSNRLGNRRLRNGEIGGRFSHAAGFRDGKQNVQVA